MKLIQIDSSHITLSGITLNSSFTLSNPHQMLAVMFQLEANPACFDIEPERGMILRGEKKFVKIRLKPELRSQARKLERQSSELFVKATYYCQYNRKLLEKNDLRGWRSVSKKYFEQSIAIKLNFQAELERLKDSLKRGNSMKHSKGHNSFQKFRDSSIKRVKDPKLNEDLQFIFRNQQYARQEHKSRHSDKISKHVESSHPAQIIDFKNQKAQHISPSRQLPVRKKSVESQLLTLKSSGGRSIQLLILAVLAAFCLAAGEAIGSLLKR